VGILVGLRNNWDLRWLVHQYCWSYYDKFGNTTECWGELWVQLEEPATSLGGPTSSLEAPATSLGALTTNLGALTTSLEAPTTSLGVLPTSLEVPTTSLGVPTTSLGVPTTSLGMSTISLGGPTTNLAVMTEAWKRRQHVWEHLESKRSSLGKPSSLGTVLVRLEILANTYSSTIFTTHVFSSYCYLWICVSMYQYSNPSPQHISGLSAGGAWKRFVMPMMMTINWTQRCTWRLCLSEIGVALRRP